MEAPMPRSLQVTARLLLALCLLAGPVYAGTMTLLGVGKPAVGGGATCASVLPGLVLNLDASNSSSVIRTGSNVTAWNDLSGGGNNFTATNNPQYSATGFNGSLPGVTVTVAANNFLKNASFPFNSATMSIFIVYVATSSTAIDDGFASFQAAGASDDFGTQKGFVISENHFGKIATTSGSYFAQNFSSVNNVPRAYGNVFDGANGTEYFDFSAGTTAAHTTNFGGASNGILTFGSRPWNGNTPDFDGTYGEIIMTSSALNGTQLSALHSCWSAKWGIP